MVGRYRPGAPDTEPCSLRVAAINFQARTGEKLRAIEPPHEGATLSLWTGA